LGISLCDSMLFSSILVKMANIEHDPRPIPSSKSTNIYSSKGARNSFGDIFKVRLSPM